MGSVRIDFVSRYQTPHVREIDKDVKNAWRWDWLDRKVDGIYLKEIIKKLTKSGVAYCLPCSKEIQYGSRGFVALVAHVTSSKHKTAIQVQKKNLSISGKSKINECRVLDYEALNFLGDNELSSSEVTTEADVIIKVEDDIEMETLSIPTEQEMERDDILMKQGTLTITPALVTPRSINQSRENVDHNSSMTKNSQNSSQTVDNPTAKEPSGPNEIDSFFIYVAAKVKKYSHETQNRVQHAVFDILVRADRGMFDLPTNSTYSQSCVSQVHETVSHPVVPSDSQISVSTNCNEQSPTATTSS